MKTLPIIFSIALFCAAFLSFAVQPILGKMMLPMVGGSPAGWIVAMAFFQIALLGGYGLSYLLGRLSPWAHAAGLVLLYVAGYTFLPPHLPFISDDVSHLSVTVTMALAKTILLPFLALTATTAALQRVFSATKHPTAQDPYYLFVASNAGSFAGLFIYPFLLEPFTGLTQQAFSWQMIYAAAILLIILACALAWGNRRDSAVTQQGDNAVAPVSSKLILRWMVLAFVPCSLSMGVTNLITTDIGGLPLFWVMPLGLYLLTFILAFAKKPVIASRQLNFMHVIAAFFAVMALGIGKMHQSSPDVFVFLFLVIALLAAFFVIAWACHQNLADSRPVTKHLTLYYFIIALGGGLAGLVHAFVIPFVLKDVIEFPAMILLSLLLLAPAIDLKKIEKYNRLLISTTIIGIIAVCISIAMRYNNFSRVFYLPFNFIFFFAVLFATVKPRLLFVLGAVALTAGTIANYAGTVVERKRNFFGQYAIYDDSTEHNMTVRYMKHGTTIHGLQVIKGFDENNRLNYGYYARNNPIQDVLTITNAKTLAVTGLGSGQMACYDRNLVTDFYEIDPDMEQSARNHYTFLKECPPRDVFIGDGRRMLEKEGRTYDVLMMDAFSSDGVPLHLVTKEALEMYLKRLSKNGMILFHVSNRYLKLQPPIAAVAATQGLVAYSTTYIPARGKTLDFASQWVVVPTNADQIKQLESMKRWKLIKPMEGHPWTDDRSSLLPAISGNTVY